MLTSLNCHNCRGDACKLSKLNDSNVQRHEQSSTMPKKRTRLKVGHVSKVCTIPFDCALNSSHPIVMVNNPSNKDDIFMVLYDNKSSEIKLIKYSLKHNHFKDIQYIDDFQFNIFGVDAIIPSRKSIIEQHLIESKVKYEYIHINKNCQRTYPLNNNTSFQLLNFSHINKHCILVIINCHQPKTWTSYITSKDNSSVHQWFGIFNCKSMKFEHCTTLENSKISRGHYCTLYKNWLFIASGSGKHKKNVDQIDQIHIFKLIQKHNYLPVKQRNLYDRISINAKSKSNRNRKEKKIDLETIHGAVVVELCKLQFCHTQTIIHNFTIPSSIFHKMNIVIIFYGTGKDKEFCTMLYVALRIPAATLTNFRHVQNRLGLQYCVQFAKYPGNDYSCNEMFNVIAEQNHLNDIRSYSDGENIYSGHEIQWYNYRNFVHLYMPEKNVLMFFGGVTFIYKPYDQEKLDFESPEMDVMRLCEIYGDTVFVRLQNVFYFDCFRGFWDVSNCIIDKYLVCDYGRCSNGFWAVNMLRVQDHGYYIVLKQRHVEKGTISEWQLHSLVLSNDKSIWNAQRLIWIGYYKLNCNQKDSECLLRLLPKDLIKLIVAFVV